MPDPKSRARVERLLSGEFRPDDLTLLFLYARDHCDGRESVRDIGDFVAHHNERDRGIITRSTRDWFTVARFLLPRFAPKAPPLEGHRMPPAAADYFRIAVKRIGTKRIRNQTGLRGPEAYALMNKLADRLIKNQDGTWALPSLTESEHKLVVCVSSMLIVRPAFEAEHLCEEFFATLKSNGLISKQELTAKRDFLRMLIQLYAVAAMHNCVVQIGDGTTTQLKARSDLAQKQISVDASVQDAVPGSNVSVATSIFATNTDPEVHCHPDLLTNSAWDFEIELDQNGRLTRLG